MHTWANHYHSVHEFYCHMFESNWGNPNMSERINRMYELVKFEIRYKPGEEDYGEVE